MDETLGLCVSSFLTSTGSQTQTHRRQRTGVIPVMFFIVYVIVCQVLEAPAAQIVVRVCVDEKDN